MSNGGAPALVVRRWVVAALAAALLACSPDSPERLMASAKDHLAKREYEAAIIQAKNLLQIQPDNGEVRLLIGEAYLATRDPVSAEKDLQRAIELGQPNEKAVPLYVRALLDQGKSDAVIREVEKHNLFDPRAVASTRAALGDAYAAKGDRERATAAYQAALAAIPGYPRARLGVAIQLAADGKAAEAMKQADDLIASEPKFAEAHALKSDLLLVAGRRDEAKKSLEQAIAADANLLAARFSLISVLIDEKAFEEATRQIEAARKIAPNDLRSSYFSALLAFRKGELQKAREDVQQVLKLLPNHVPSLVLSGTIELRLNQLASAESAFNRALAQAPNHLDARRSLIATQLRMGHPARARESLDRLVERGMPRDPQLLLLAGETYLANGDVRRANAFYNAAAASKDVQNAAAKTRLGQIALATGSTEQGFKELETAAELDAAQYQADLALITGHLQRRDFDKAMAAVQALEKKQPKNPVTFQMYGLVHLAKRDLAAARRNFEKALELQPNYLPAAQNLASLDLLEKKPGDARKRYEALITKDPKNDQLYVALAELQARTGADAKEVGATLRRAVEANPQSVPARLALIGFHVRINDAKSAVSVAQNANAALPNDARIVEALGIALEAAGEINQAVETFTRLAGMSPQAPEPLIRLASLYAKQKEWDKSIETLRRAQRVAPRPDEAVTQIVQVYMAADRVDDALKEARELQKREPKLANGWSLEGDVLSSQKRWPEAAKAYREALQLAPKANMIAIRLYGALSSAEMKSEAEAVAKKWLAENPRDATMSLYLGDRELQARNFRSAANHYRMVLARSPNNPFALNNLANALDAAGDPKAMEYAEQAAKVAPNSPAILDTLGGILVRRGQAGKGVEYLERAVNLAPGRNDIRLNYAKGLIKAGRKDAARRELDVLQAVKDDFPGKAEIAGLLNGL